MSIKIHGSLRAVRSIILFGVLIIMVLSLAEPAAAKDSSEIFLGAADAAGLIPDELAGREDEYITKHEFFTLILRLYDILTENTPQPEDNPVQRAKELGLFPEQLGQDPSLTRQEASAVLVRLIDLVFENADITLHTNRIYTDNRQIARWAKPAMDYLFDHQILNVNEEYEIFPLQPVSIGEAITMAYKVYEKDDRFAVRTVIPDEWEWHIKPQFDGLVPNTRFAGGLAAVSKDGKYGYIDWNGNVVIDFEYDMAYEFSEGRARIIKDGKTGYIDRKGNIVIPAIYSAGGDFSEGRVWLQLDGKYGFADKNGNVVIPLEYDYAYEFSEGIAPVKKNGKYGYIDYDGNLVIPFKYDWASSFSEGKARVGSRGEYSYIDKTGEIILDLKYDYLFDFSDGRAIVFNRDQYAVIDEDGNFIIPFRKWGFIFGFNDGLSRVHADSGYEGIYRYIDTEGNVVIQGQQFMDADDFSEGLAAVSTHNKITDKVTRSYMTRTGELVLPKRVNIEDESPYDSETFYLQQFSEGLAAVVNNQGKLGFVQNPLLNLPVTTLAVLEISEEPEAGSTFSLTYGLHNARNVFAQDVVIRYDNSVFELDENQSAEVIENNTMIINMENEPGRIRILLPTLGIDNALNGNMPIMKLNFKTIGNPAGSVINVESLILADKKGNEFEGVPANLTVIIRKPLDLLIGTAQDKYDDAEEGYRNGNYILGTKALLQAAISSAQRILDNQDATQSEIDEAFGQLNIILEKVESKMITPSMGDVSGIDGQPDGIINRMDVEYVAGHYETAKGDLNWDEVKKADINGDDVIDLYDLAFTGRRISE